MEKELLWVGSSLRDLKAFPKNIQGRIGYQLSQLQGGDNPSDFKPMSSVAKGVYEIRTSGESGTYRAMYITKVATKIVILHCFQKKTRTTSSKDLDIARTRYKDFMRDINKEVVRKIK